METELPLFSYCSELLVITRNSELPLEALRSERYPFVAAGFLNALRKNDTTSYCKFSISISLTLHETHKNVPSVQNAFYSQFIETLHFFSLMEFGTKLL